VGLLAFFCQRFADSADGGNAPEDYRCLVLISLWLVGLDGFAWRWLAGSNLKRAETLRTLSRVICSERQDGREQCIYSPYILSREPAMTIARIFQSGNSQAVRLPKEFRFNTDRVEIFRQGNDIILRERPATGAVIFDALAELPDDFMDEGRADTPPQVREGL